MHVMLVVWRYSKGAIGGTGAITDTWAAVYRRLGHTVSILSLDDPQADVPRDGAGNGWVEEPGPTRIWRTAIWQNVVIPPDPLTTQEWKTFIDLLNHIRPDAVLIINNAFFGIDLLSHLVDLKLPTLVMSYDHYAFTCMRLYLVRADGSQCDGKVIPRVCAACSAMGTPLADNSDLLRWARRTGFSFFKRFPIQSAIPLHPRLQRSLQRASGKLEMLQRFSSLPIVYVANNWRHCEILAQNGIPRDKIVYSPMGLDLSETQLVDLPLPCRGKSNGSSFTFGYVGRCSPESSLDMLLTAFDQVKRQCPAARLRLYTRFDNPFDVQVNASYVRRCRRLADSLAGVSVSSQRVADDLRAAYAQIDMTILPCRWIHNGSRICVESLAMKRPLIVGRYTSMTDLVVDGHNGLFFDGTVPSLVEVMLKAARDPVRVVAMSRNCHLVGTAEEEVTLHLKLIENLRAQLNS